MVTATQRLAYRFEEVRNGVVNVEEKLKEMKEKVFRIKKSLNSVKINVSQFVGLYTLNFAIILAGYNSYEDHRVSGARFWFVMLHLLSFIFIFVLLIVLPFQMENGTLRRKKNDIEYLLRWSLFDLRWEIGGICCGYSPYVKACDEMEVRGKKLLGVARLYGRMLWGIAFCAFVFNVGACVLLF